ncbi:hypothetical protein KVT40_008695 [Elsinoe batatas]|uniref:Uncharacterized protein n=1 Tax=Elsinoe batatas TaxID=2601811 RepID=A0A8K0KTT5_9PEZI|nr:hypothetical protein KVT40_008695 [Elsinoe batatas]
MRVLAYTAIVATISASAMAAPELAPRYRDVENRDLSTLYATAQKETGTLQVAWGGDEKTQASGIVQAFQAAFPLIKVNFTVDLSKYHDGRINNQFQDGDFYADVAVLQTLQGFDNWKAKGWLQNYKPASFDKLFPEFTDRNGAYLPYFGGQCYLTASVPTQDIPTSYADVLDPKWKGKLVLTYPNDDDAVLYSWTLIVQKYGWDWVRKLAQQDVQWVRGTATPASVINGSTTRTLTFTSFPLGADWSFVAPKSDRYMSWFQTSAILKNTKMPDTARLLQSFLVSDDWQRGLAAAGTSSARSDFTNRTSGFGLSNTDYTSFRPFMRQRDLVEGWRFQFEDILGTAQGLSPLLDTL